MLGDYLSIILEFLGQMVERYGALGIAAAMFTESLGVPFASTVVFLSAGSLIYSGKITFWPLFGASTAGITLGSIAGYFLGYVSRAMGHVIKLTFRGRRLSRKPPEVKKKSKVWQFIEHYGSFSVFMAQLFGLTRTFISFPAGIMKMNLPLFTVYTALGGALFSLVSISLSILLTGVVKAFYGYIRLLLHQPAPVWIVTVALVAGMIWLYRHLGWKVPLDKLIDRGKSWLERRM